MSRLFNKVKCKAYLKKDLKYVYVNAEDKTIENEEEIYLGYGDSVIQSIYKLVEKEFEGIVVGIIKIVSKREYVECYFDETNSSEIITNSLDKIEVAKDKIEVARDKIEVAKVYYGNNKSRLVPLEYLEVSD